MKVAHAHSCFEREVFVQEGGGKSKVRYRDW